MRHSSHFVCKWKKSDIVYFNLEKILQNVYIYMIMQTKFPRNICALPQTLLIWKLVPHKKNNARSAMRLIANSLYLIGFKEVRSI